MKKIETAFISVCCVILLNSCSQQPTTTHITDMLTSATTLPGFPTPTKSQTPTTTVATVPTATPVPEKTATTSPYHTCIDTFDTFAYSPEKRTDHGPVPPLSPWNVEVTLPDQIKDTTDSMGSIQIARPIQGHQEIWLYTYMESDQYEWGEIRYFIYQTDNHSWRSVSGEINNGASRTTDLLLSSGGTIWALIGLNLKVETPKPDQKVPVLARFNDLLQKFEFAPGGPEITGAQYDYTNAPIGLIDQEGAIWVIVDNVGLYRYDPLTQTTEKQIDLPNIVIFSAALAHDGTIYLKKRTDRIQTLQNYFHLQEDVLYHYLPDQRRMIPVALPKEPWPVFSGMVVDADDNLWLGAIGYREPNGTWKRIMQDTQKYFKVAGEAFMGPPTLMFRSSDRLLWYYKWLDMGTKGEGTAWYDPKMGTGCLFTNLVAKVIEDSDRTLWLLADKKLYTNMLSDR